MTVYSMANQAAIETLLDFCVKIGDQLGMKEIEGLPLDEWLYKRKIERMESLLIQIEDANPALAAKFQGNARRIPP